MKTKRNMILVAIAIIAISFLIVKFGLNTTTPDGKSSIIIGTFSKSMGNVPYYIAKEHGWFEEAIGDKFNIEYIEFNDRSSIASALSNGSLKFVFSAEAPAILIEAQGEDIEFTNLSCTLAQEVIVRSTSDMNNISDLIGKKIAVLAGTSSHYALLKILSDNGLSVDDVKILLMPPAEAKTAFETGSIDAWAVWPPWVEQQQVSGFAKSLEGSDAVIQCVGSIPTSFVNSDPTIVASLSSIIKRAKTWILNNEEESQRIVSKQVELDIEIVRLAWPKFDWAATYNASVLQDLQNKADFLSKEKLTRNNIVVDVEKDLISDYIKK